MKLQIVQNWGLIIRESTAILIDHCAHFSEQSVAEEILEFDTRQDAEEYALRNGIEIVLMEGVDA